MSKGIFEANLEKIKQLEEEVRQDIQKENENKKKQMDLQKQLTKQQLETDEQVLRKKLEKDKEKINLQEDDIKKQQEQSQLEIQQIKQTALDKRQELIDFIIDNVTNVDVSFPETLKKRFVKKKIKKQK